MSIGDVGVSCQQLREMADTVADRYPDAVLMKNPVGNLSVVQGGAYLGWLDLHSGGVEWLEDDDTETGERP